METKINKKENMINPIFYDKKNALIFLVLSLILMLLENFFLVDKLVGSWHIVLYIILLTPLSYMIFKNKVQNQYTKWLFPVFTVMIIDMFYYNNSMVNFFVPIIFYFLLVIVYITSMHKVHSFYQILIPRFELGFESISYVKTILENLFLKKDENKVYSRILTALLITLPFLFIFISLLYNADTKFGDFLSTLITFDLNFELKYFFTIPWFFFIYLFLFIYGFSNHKIRTKIENSNPTDLLIVGIFLTMINILFLSFITFQLPFLFEENYLPTGATIANFAREGFFQLMTVMGIVVLIFLFIMRRFKNEKLLVILLSTLLVQSMIMGLVSLKKMYLYQSIKGATVMRYYVEWFDYFLLIVLFLSIILLLRKVSFTKFLNTISILALASFCLIISLNVDYLVASHNIKKFKDNVELLDKDSISRLSIDALPAIIDTDIVIKNYHRNRNCSLFSNYHLGHCSILSKFGNSQYKFINQYKNELKD